MTDRGDLPQRVLVIADAIGATQQISFLQPLRRAIAAKEIALHFEPRSKVKTELLDYYEACKPDILVMSRFTSLDAAPLVERARATGVPIVFHIDDDLLKVPKNLGQAKYDAYNRPARLQALRTNMETADLLYASTPALAETFRSYGIAAEIIAGDLYCTVDAAAIQPPIPALEPVIGYMGSEGHAADLAMVLPAIEQLMEHIPSLRFETYGTIRSPDELARFGSRIGHHAATANYSGFLSKLCSLGWWVGLAPLEDTPFNLCKADTKWVEYSYAGVATVTSDLPVYTRACADGSGMQATTIDEWREAMMTLIVRRDARETLVARAQEKLASVYSHDALEKQVLAVFADARVKAAERRSVQA